MEVSAREVVRRRIQELVYGFARADRDNVVENRYCQTRIPRRTRLRRINEAKVELGCLALQEFLESGLLHFGQNQGRMVSAVAFAGDGQHDFVAEIRAERSKAVDDVAQRQGALRLMLLPPCAQHFVLLDAL